MSRREEGAVLKVLVMEDDASVAALIRHQLDVEGYATIHAVDLEGAWALLLAENPDAAVLDLWIGARQAGWELVERLRGNEVFETLPVVVVTGSTAAENAERARSLGCEYLNKPFSSAALTDRLQRAIQTAGRTPARRTERVVLLAGGFRIEGKVHVTGDLPRFSDAWEAVLHDTRHYIPVTDAQVTRLDGSAVVEAAILEVRKDEIIVAIPAG